jgi:UDP-N-acetylglucosamine--N-acetylmuramyl-(pentapeptide) pyrophosphoryl-undecaprenol N-acetylglucosamine transferase
VDDHQTHNARFLVDAGGGWLLPQSELHAQALSELIMRLDRAELLQKAQTAKGLQQIQATERVVQACQELLP